MTTTPPSPSDSADRVAVQCPHCAKEFRVPRASLGRRARCPCGQVFTVETPREPTSASAAAITCVNHPAVAATLACARCGKRICQTCAFPQPDGTVLCPGCISLGSVSADDRAAAALAAIAGGSASSGATAPPGSKCQRHPQADAVHLCQSCRAPICATCDFSFPGGVHLCPTCAVSPRRAITGNRRTLVGVAFALATWATVGTVLLFTGVAQEAGEGAAIAIGFLVVMPAIIGGGVGIACFDRRLGNPPVVWVAAIWNIILLAVMVTLCIVGSFM